MADFKATKITDSYGFSGENTPTDEIRVVEPARLVGTQFGAATGATPATGVTGTDPNFWTGACTNSATIDQANAQVVLTSGTNAGGTATLYTVRRARYISGISMGFRAVMQLGDTGTASNTRRWGVAWGASLPAITDAALFELAGTTLSAIVIKGSSRTAVAALTAPTTSATTYEIYWTNSKVYFAVGGVLVATHSATTATWSNTMNYHVFMDNVNAGNTTSVTLSSRSASIRRFGRPITDPIYKYQASAATTICKYGPGTLHRIIVSDGANGSSVAVYDALSATNALAVISTANVTSPASLTFDCPFYTGLTLVTVGTVSATVIYE